MSADPKVVRDVSRDRIHVLTINRPEVRNATDRETTRIIDGYVRDAEQDPCVRCLVLTGSGATAFSAGNDITEMAAVDEAAMLELQRERETSTWRWATTRLPTIAALNGLAYGNGAILALAADMRVGSARCSMRITATGFGGANDTWILPALTGWSHAKDMLLTGRVVAGDELYRMGLLNRLAEDGNVLTTALSLAEVIADNPSSGPQDAKRLVIESLGRSLRERFDAENILQRERLAATPMSSLFAARTTAHGADDADPRRQVIV